MTTEKILRMTYLMRQSSRDTLPDEDQREMFVLIAESIHGDPILPSQETEIKIKESEKMKNQIFVTTPQRDSAIENLAKDLAHKLAFEEELMKHGTRQKPSIGAQVNLRILQATITSLLHTKPTKP